MDEKEKNRLPETATPNLRTVFTADDERYLAELIGRLLTAALIDAGILDKS